MDRPAFLIWLARIRHTVLDPSVEINKGGPSAKPSGSSHSGANRHVTGERPMKQRCLAITVTALALAFGAADVSAAGDEWTSKAVKALLPGGKESQEKATLTGKFVPRDEKDKDGNPITSAFLEQDDGSLDPPALLAQEGQRNRRQGSGQGRGQRLLLEVYGRKGGDRGNGPVDHEGRETDPAPDQDHRNQAPLARAGCGRECPASASRVTWNPCRGPQRQGVKKSRDQGRSSERP